MHLNLSIPLSFPFLPFFIFSQKEKDAEEAQETPENPLAKGFALRKTGSRLSGIETRDRSSSDAGAARDGANVSAPAAALQPTDALRPRAATLAASVRG